MELNEAQQVYLENLLQSSSVEMLSPGIASVLLHLQGLDPGELLTVSLICSGLWHDHEDAISALSSLKSSEVEAAAGIYTLLSNTLKEQSGILSATGNENQEPEGPTSENLTEGLVPPTM